MAWSKLDDQFHDNGKILSFSHRAFRLYVCSITYTARHKTRGKMTAAQALALARQQDCGAKDIKELVEKAGWDATDDGYQIHDYEHYNPVDPTAADRMRRHRDAAKGDESKASDESVTEDVTEESVTEIVTSRNGHAPSRTRTRAGSPSPSPFPAANAANAARDPFDPTRPDPLAEEKASTLEANPHWENALTEEIAKIAEREPIRNLLPLQAKILRGWLANPETAPPKPKPKLRTADELRKAGYLFVTVQSDGTTVQ